MKLQYLLLQSCCMMTLFCSILAVVNLSGQIHRPRTGFCRKILNASEKTKIPVSQYDHIETSSQSLMAIPG